MVYFVSKFFICRWIGRIDELGACNVVLAYGTRQWLVRRKETFIIRYLIDNHGVGDLFHDPPGKPNMRFGGIWMRVVGGAKYFYPKSLEKMNTGGLGRFGNKSNYAVTSSMGQ